MGEESTRRVVASSRDATVSPVSVHVDSWRPSAIANKMEPIGKSTASSWNTRNLGLKLGADFTAAAAAGALVAPIITIIDRYVPKLKKLLDSLPYLFVNSGIIENASGRNTLGGSLKSSLRQMLFRPHRFVFSKPFALIFVRSCYPTTNVRITNISPSVTVLWHLHDCQLNRHRLLDPPYSASFHDHGRALQIRRNLCLQSRPMPLQR